MTGWMYESYRHALQMIEVAEIAQCTGSPARHYFADDSTLCSCRNYVIDGFKVRLR